MLWKQASGRCSISDPRAGGRRGTVEPLPGDAMTKKIKVQGIPVACGNHATYGDQLGFLPSHLGWSFRD